MKRCYICRERLPLASFVPGNRRCRTCDAAYHRERYHARKKGVAP